MMLMQEQTELVGAARQARDAAYARYSQFHVGAAVRSRSGRIFTGCNIENASYGLSMCAERVAIFNAVSAGEREIAEIAVLTDASQPSPPCGACRQVLYEFGKTAKVILANLVGSTIVSDIQTLFPQPFTLDR